MTFEDYWRLLRRGWWLLATFTVIGALLGVLFTSLSPKVYTTESVAFAMAPSNVEHAGTVDAVAKSRIKSYLELAKTEDIASLVAETLGIGTPPEELLERIAVYTPFDTIALRVIASGPTAIEAQELANAWIEVLAAEVNELERETASTTVEAVEQITLVPRGTAPLPTSPNAPSLALGVAFGVFVGFAVGVVILLARGFFDRRVRALGSLERLFSLPVLGELVCDQTIKDAEKRLIATGATRDNPQLALAERLSILRAGVQFVDAQGNRAKTIAVTSPQPQEATSTIATNLARSIAETGEVVVIIDGDLRHPHLSSFYDVPGTAGLADYLAGRSRLEEVIVRLEAGLQLYLLPAGSLLPNPSELLSSSKFGELITLLSTHASVVIDSPPLLPIADGAVIAAHCDAALMVVGMDETRLDDLGVSLDKVERFGGRTLGFVVNRLPLDEKGSVLQDPYVGLESFNEEIPRPVGSDFDLLKALTRVPNSAA